MLTYPGGTNPAIRTLFYRLVRLLGTPIQPIFVFDGPNKPTFKRNKRSGRGDGVATAMAKRLIRLFGFPVHDAPGEGEAECAFLQRQGVVDAVLSEDVDTIMFGCTKTLRDWSAEGKTSKTPTHVSLYDVQKMALSSLGLDREGMVLVALMSGGDYLPDGIPGCGVKVACEAAKAGFGKSICRLKASDKAGIQAWRNNLIHELQTNEKGYFRTKHKALSMPEDFPNIEVLRYYTHPVVSAESNIEVVRQKMEQKQELHLAALREFTRETFDWDYRIGAIKFIRVLGQALLVKNMTEMSDTKHVKRISGRRTHFSTDATPELRLAYIPEEVVPIDLTKEVDEVISSGRTGLALNSDEELDAIDAVESSASTPKLFDVTKPDLAWVLEGLVKKSTPSAFQEWQVKELAKALRQSPTKKKAGVAKKTSKTSDMPRGSLDKYAKTTKAAAALTSGQDPFKALDRSSSPLQSPTRPAARSNLSKQSSSSPTRSPKKTTVFQEIDSSPVTLRFSKAQKQPEAIYISSSPAVPTSSSPSPPSNPGPRSSAGATFLQPSQVPESIQSIIQATRSIKGVKAPPQRQQPREPQSTKSELKQSSMEMFISKPKTTTATKGATRKANEVQIDSDSDLEPLSSIVQPPSPIKRVSTIKETPLYQEKESPKITTSPKKKLLRVRPSGSGFFDEVELDAEQRDAQLTSKTGKRTGLVRWSDVSIIDLTEVDK